MSNIERDAGPPGGPGDVAAASVPSRPPNYEAEAGPPGGPGDFEAEAEKES